LTESWRDEYSNRGDFLYWESLRFSIAHQKTAERWNNVAVFLGMSTTMLSAFAGASLVAESKNWVILAGVIALIVSVLSAVNTYLKPGEWKVNHETAHKSYLALTNEAELFLTQCRKRFENVAQAQEVLGDSLKLLLERKSKLQIDSPMLPTWAEECAQKKIDELVKKQYPPDETEQTKGKTEVTHVSKV